MINIVLFEPEIPGNTGNIMRTCVATNTKLHLIEPLGFQINDKTIKRSGVNYIDKLDYTIYEDFNDFLNKNKGEFRWVLELIQCYFFVKINYFDYLTS